MEDKSCVIRVFLILFFLFTGCAAQHENTTEDSVDDSGIQKSIENFTLVETQGEKKQWVMNAESAIFIETKKGEIIEAKTLTIEFFEDSNGSKTFLKAEKGRYNKKTQILTAIGKVEIKTDVRKIITSDVKWYPKKKIFVSDKEVLISTEDGIIRGMGMEASMDLKNITIKNRIEGELEN